MLLISEPYGLKGRFPTLPYKNQTGPRLIFSSYKKGKNKNAENI